MSMYVGVSGIKAATTDLNATSHNIANASTYGFKNSRAEFADLVDSSAAMGGGLGVKTQAVNQLFQQGAIIPTGKTLDFAITGQGFFVVQDVDDAGAPVGDPIYTRAGSFSVDAEGFIVNNLGQRLQGESGDLQLEGDGPWSNITFNPNTRQIEATDSDDNTAFVPNGPLALVDFPNVQGLRKVSDTQWRQTEQSGPATAIDDPPANIGRVMSGALEGSNVDLTDQLVNMILAQRNFQANSQTITTNNTLTQTILNIR